MCYNQSVKQRSYPHSKIGEPGRGPAGSGKEHKMKKPMSGKKLLSLCLALVLVLALLPGEVLAVDGGGGHCGDGLSWALNNGILTISGSGGMYSYSEETAPWYRQRTQVKAVVFAGNDVTSVGDYAFYGCTNLVSVDLPENLNQIGTRAFPAALR